MESTKVIGFLIFMWCPFFAVGNSDFQKWSGIEAGASDKNPHAEIQAVISKEVDDNIRASMEKKIDERFESSELTNSASDFVRPNIGFIQQVGQ